MTFNLLARHHGFPLERRKTLGHEQTDSDVNVHVLAAQRARHLRHVVEQLCAFPDVVFGFRRQTDHHVEFDGGVTVENAASIVAAGADVLVAGNTIFKSADPKATIKKLKDT